jgi:hypothetical protein
VQWWQVVLVFVGGPLALFGVIWALVWLTTEPGTAPPGVTQPSEAPSGDSPRLEPGEGEVRPGEALDPAPREGGCQDGDKE